MHTSRLGKFVIVLAGAIGFLYVGGGHAHADAVSVNNVSVTNNSTSSQSVGGAAATVINDTTKQVGATVSDITNNDPPTSVGSVDASVQPGQPNDKTTGLAPINSEPSILSEQTTTTDKSVAPVVTSGSGTSSGSGDVIPSAAQASASQVAYYPPKQIQPTMLPSSQNPPLATANDGSGHPKTPEPTLPQGAFVLVSTVGAPSPMVKFLTGSGAPAKFIHTSLVLLLVLILSSLTALVTSAFLSYLKASGYSIAPRGSTPQFNFAFPVGEFELSHRLKTSSLFSTPQRLLGGWWYQGGRI